jgi:dCTP deaminase
VRAREAGMAAGVLNNEQLIDVLFDPNTPAWIPNPASDKLPDVDGSAIDLPIGNRYWIMRGSCRPNPQRDLRQLLDDNKFKGPFTLEPNTLFKTGQVYWIELQCEKLQLPKGVHGRSTAKSTIGRLDAMVRLLSDREGEFDKVSPESGGQVYLEVVPISFDLLLSPGVALSQLRLLRGDERLCSVPVEALFLENEPVLLTRGGVAYTFEAFADDYLAVPLSLDLSPDPVLKISGFQAIQATGRPAINPSLKGGYDPTEYWRPVQADKGTVLIKRDEFYIFRSVERFRIPDNMAVDCRAYSEGLGDIRIHYAGFAHPMFGKKNPDGSVNKHGAPLIFEVRGFTMDSVLRDGATLAKVYFRRMSKLATKSDGAYSDQELKLSKVFKDWQPK